MCRPPTPNMIMMSSPSTPTTLHDPTSAAYKKAKKRYIKTTRNRPDNPESDWTPFRAAEKKFKARFPPPDLSNVLDLAMLDESRSEEIKLGGWRGSVNAVEHRKVPLLNCDEGSASSYQNAAVIFPNIPGLVLLPSFISQQEQLELVQWSLRDHARSPNETNLDTHYVIPEEGLWNTYVEARKDASYSDVIQPRAACLSPSDLPEEKPGPRQLISNEAANKENYLELSSTAKLPSAPSLTVKPASPITLLPKLRWANIGWYYHWGSKQYDFARGKIEVSDTIQRVCKRVVGSVPWEEVFRGEESDWGDDGPEWKDWHQTYEPDAGIVNFYQTKDTLMAHVDRSELCATSPLVSISLGCAAIFLIGGHTRDTEPVPILLRSGDVVIMSGPGCRRAYHGVPRILEDTLPPHFSGGILDKNSDWPLFEEYLRTTRVNINVRQVFPKGFDPKLGKEA